MTRTAIVIAIGLTAAWTTGCGGSQEEVAPADQVEPQTIGEEGLTDEDITDEGDIPPEDRMQPADIGDPALEADPVEP